MGEQHLDALSIVARPFERLGLAECPSDIAGLLVDTARDLARRLLRTAPHLERADVAAELAGSVKQQVVIHDFASAREGLPAQADLAHGSVRVRFQVHCRQGGTLATWLGLTLAV